MTVNMLQRIRMAQHKFVYLIAAIILTVQTCSFYVTFTKRISYNDLEQYANESCHSSLEDSLISTSCPNFVPPIQSIFFHSTSCRGGLNSRAACSVESAARLHPNWTVHVLFNAPVSKLILKRSCLNELKKFPNVKFARVQVDEYIKHTDFEDIIDWNLNSMKNWQAERMSDLLRWVTLLKYGGIYLDLDMLVVKPLDRLGFDWTASDDGESINGAVFAAISNVGRNLVEMIVNLIRMDYMDNLWTYNGPRALTRIIKKRCRTDDIAKFTVKKCNGFQVYPSDKFYPIHRMMHKKYFEIDYPENYADAYTHHFWYELTKNTKIEKYSLYSRLAKKYCPTIYEMYGVDFGS